MDLDEMQQVAREGGRITIAHKATTDQFGRASGNGAIVLTVNRGHPGESFSGVGVTIDECLVEIAQKRAEWHANAGTPEAIAERAAAQLAMDKKRGRYEEPLPIEELIEESPVVDPPP